MLLSYFEKSNAQSIPSQDSAFGRAVICKAWATMAKSCKILAVCDANVMLLVLYMYLMFALPV